ncbi:hypothetical protein ACPCUF_00830 [Streptomyces griseoincarnatus]
MFRIISAKALTKLRTEAITARGEATRSSEAVADARAETNRLRASLARAEGELAVLRAQSYLDAEDRVALRTLLRTVRKQAGDRDKVAVLFRRGQLHSLHDSTQAAEAAAEAEGAPAAGWVCVPGDAPPPTTPDVSWAVRMFRVQGER